MATHWSLRDVTEGWSKWQIALCVGAPIALGVAGVWYYTRKQSKSQVDDSSQGDSKSAGKKSEPEAPQVGLPVCRSETGLVPALGNIGRCLTY